MERRSEEDQKGCSDNAPSDIGRKAGASVASADVVANKIELIMNNETIARLAEERIRERGWCQRAFEELDGRVCLLGAVNLACTSCADHSNSVAYKFRTHLKYELFDDPATWNDDPMRTKEEVLAVLRRIAEGKRALPWRQRMGRKILKSVRSK